MPPTFGTTKLTIEQLLERNRRGARPRQYALKLHDKEVRFLHDYCDTFNLDRYHMPDATNILRLLHKMDYVQGLKGDAEVREVAFRVSRILIDNCLGNKDQYADTEVEILAQKVADLWKTKHLAVKEHESGDQGDEEEEEVEVGWEDVVENDDESRARLENIYASPAVDRTLTPKHRPRRATSTPAPAVKPTAAEPKVKNKPKSTARANNNHAPHSAPPPPPPPSPVVINTPVATAEDPHDDNMRGWIVQWNDLRAQREMLRNTIAEMEVEDAEIQREVRKMRKVLAVVVEREGGGGGEADGM